MLTSGLLILLDSTQQIAEKGISTLKTDTRFTFGDRIEKTLQPAVLETQSAKEAREATDLARSILGILEVHVVSVDFQTNLLNSTSGGTMETTND
ncbi:MAG: hypothetical protein ISR75_06720 [Phycisphaerales bacterium]|nr:hypothetical protein [Planctomycetota bacterium]MBL6998112.1 hypothetical protein [Phycisphaerales bacterium]